MSRTHYIIIEEGGNPRTLTAHGIYLSLEKAIGRAYILANDALRDSDRASRRQTPYISTLQKSDDDGAYIIEAITEHGIKSTFNVMACYAWDDEPDVGDD